MGNYAELEYEFIERTLALISQYESIKNSFKFKEQYNYTLLINCLLGLLVMPKERIFSFKPNDRLTEKLRADIGLPKSIIHSSITNLNQLITELKHSIAHFDIKAESVDERLFIDEIVFNNKNGMK
jgi:hypothetical protein